MGAVDFQEDNLCEIVFRVVIIWGYVARIRFRELVFPEPEHPINAKLFAVDSTWSNRNAFKSPLLMRS